jgi:hypothetical protein
MARRRASESEGRGHTLWADRRVEERLPASGEVMLRLAEPGAAPVWGSLRDISTRGFRAAHNSPRLESGSLVTFQHGTARGTARVAWNRMVDGEWESGFVIV